MIFRNEPVIAGTFKLLQRGIVVCEISRAVESPHGLPVKMLPAAVGFQIRVTQTEEAGYFLIL